MKNIIIKCLTAIVLSLSLIQCSLSNDEDVLQFSENEYKLETFQIATKQGNLEVICKSYSHIPYVAKPVDLDYQSLDLLVPVSINGKDIDASNAPIFFNIKVGGYMSVRNKVDDDMEDKPKQLPGISSDKSMLALAAGYVVVTPGCRGRDNLAEDGTYYGKAPAAIVDLKATVRYLRHNKEVIPGDEDKIVSVGCSAGGALSALLGASGDNELFDPYLKEIGAADESDKIYATACYSPITDLEHADMAYEWMYGTLPVRSGLVDQELSQILKGEFEDYQSSLALNGKNGFGEITAQNYAKYLTTYYLIPSANNFLSALSEEQLADYLSKNPWITWKEGKADFTFEAYLPHIGRMKGLPAFDDFQCKSPENIVFGNASLNARHFTNFSMQKSNGDEHVEIDNEVKHLVNLMNAMYFIINKNEGCSQNWWLRNGTVDFHTSQTVMVNLSTALQNQNKLVNDYIFWDCGHCQDADPEGLIQWIGEITKL
nr:subtype B tannase [uncultured Carboxylicivirga sp.]